MAIQGKGSLRATSRLPSSHPWEPHQVQEQNVTVASDNMIFFGNDNGTLMAASDGKSNES